MDENYIEFTEVVMSGDDSYKSCYEFDYRYYIDTDKFVTLILNKHNVSFIEEVPEVLSNHLKSTKEFKDAMRGYKIKQWKKNI